MSSGRPLASLTERNSDYDGISLAVTPASFSLWPSFSVDTPDQTYKRRNPWIQHWAAITPLIVGGLGPTLTLLAISGCADNWRVIQLPSGLYVAEKDATWVLVCTGLAIVIGFIANVFMLLRMMGRGNPKHMQNLSIILWTVECKCRLQSH